MKIDRSRVFAPPDLAEKGANSAVAAIKALAEGKASAVQQKLALDWIISELCRTYDVSFRPDDAGGDRDTAFAEGRRFVGLQIRRVITRPADELTGKRKVDHG